MLNAGYCHYFINFLFWNTKKTENEKAQKIKRTYICFLFDGGKVAQYVLV